MMRWAAIVGIFVMLTACSSKEPPPDLARELPGKMKADVLYAHLHELQRIADTSQGSRSKGTPGYDASVDYAAQFLRDKGFDVDTPEFEILGRSEGGDPTLTVAGRDYGVDQASLLKTTPPEGLRAITLRPTKPAGCRAADYRTVSVKGAIAIVDDSGCSVVDKQDAAIDNGAVGLLVVSSPESQGSPAGLFEPGYYHQLTIPVAVIDKDVDAVLRRTTSPVELVLDRKPVMVKTRNVLAQTETGDTENVVMVGAPLDSPLGSPGINDNGSGVAAVLEIAAALGPRPQITNAVRFALWGSEVNALQGASKYLHGLEPTQIDDIALYLNLHMLGSLNAGYFTYDGDQSAQPNPDIPPSSVPDGSAGIERTLAGYLNLAGHRPADMPLSTTVDYHAFLRAGVPVGGLTTGASQRKSEVQSRLWGGRSGVAFDPNYRTARDTIDNVNRDALSAMGAAAAFAVGTYAQSIDGVNGVASHDQRRSR